MQHAAAMLPRPASAAPLAGLAGSDLSRRFRHWRGLSGKRHLFSVFPLREPGPGEDAPRFAGAVVMAVGRDAHGEPRILALDETGVLPDLVYDGPRFRAAAAAGADEIHVHLLAADASARARVLRDLEHRPIRSRRSDRESDAQAPELERFSSDQVIPPDRKAL